MFQHAGTREIRTERLLLRKFRPGDASAMYANWTSDPEVARYVNWGAHEGPETTRGFLDFLLGKQERPDNYAWGIELAGELVGAIDVVEADEGEKRCAIGYCLSRKCWNRGVMTEALRGVIDYLFLNTDYERIQAEHMKLNPASGRVMEKAGMRFLEERTVPIKKDGSLQALRFYEVTRQEWEGEGGNGA